MIEPAAKPCIACRQRRPIDLFPLATPRADGSRHRYRFCVDCLSERVRVGVSPDERRTIAAVTHRESRVRRRRQTGHW